MFVVAAVLTPPDIVSQTSLAVPLIILFEASIISCRMVEKARARREAEEDAELAGKGKPATGGRWTRSRLYIVSSAPDIVSSAPGSREVKCCRRAIPCQTRQAS
jgi:hypothetical protein